MSRPSRLVPIGGVDGTATFVHGDGCVSVQLHQAGQSVARFSMDYDIAATFARALLTEVGSPSGFERFSLPDRIFEELSTDTQNWWCDNVPDLYVKAQS